MRKTRVLCAALSVLLLTGSLQVPAAAAETKEYSGWHYTIEKTGEFQAPSTAISVKEKSPILSDIIWQKQYLLGIDGEKIGDAIAGAAYLGDGLYQVRSDWEDWNHAGVYTETGEEVLPFEAFEISRIGSNNSNYVSERFLRVTVATGTTKDMTDYIAYVEERDGTRYNLTGYYLVYDMQEKRYVEGVSTDIRGSQSVRGCGNAILVTIDDNHSTLYDAEGNVLAELRGYVYCSGDYVLVQDTQTRECVLINDRGEVFNTGLASVDVIASDEGCFRYSIYDRKNEVTRYGLFSMERFPMTSPVYTAVRSESGGLFAVTTEDGDGKLVDWDGNVYAEGLSYPEAVLPGYWWDSETKKLVTPDGVFEMESTGGGSRLTLQNAAGDYFVLADGDYTLSTGQGSYASALGTALVSVRDDDSRKYGVYELFTGEALLPAEYDQVYAAGDALYVSKGKNWEVYRVGLERDENTEGEAEPEEQEEAPGIAASYSAEDEQGPAQITGGKLDTADEPADGDAPEAEAPVTEEEEPEPEEPEPEEPEPEEPEPEEPEQGEAFFSEMPDLPTPDSLVEGFVVLVKSGVDMGDEIWFTYFASEPNMIDKYLQIIETEFDIRLKPLEDGTYTVKAGSSEAELMMDQSDHTMLTFKFRKNAK